jgi:hypothetical protein
MVAAVGAIAFAPQGIAQPRDAAGAAAAVAGLPQGIEVVIEDEITVVGERRPRTVVTIDREIESTVMSFYRLLNEVVVSPDFHVD